MKDIYKTKKQLIEDLDDFRKQIKKLKKSEAKHKNTDKLIKASADEWRMTFDSINDAVCLLDIDGKIIRCNKAMSKLLNKPFTEIIGHKCWELMHGTSEPIPECPVVRMKKTLKRETLILPLNNKWFEVTSDPIFDEAGNLIEAVHVITDVTGSKQAEKRLRQSERRYRELYEGSRDGYAMVNMEGTIVESNISFKEMLGYTDEELLKKTYEDITPLKWHSLEAKIIESQVMKRCFSEVYEKEYIRKDGTVFPIAIRTYLLKDEDGNPRAMWAFVRDITERKEAEESLKESEERFMQITENAEEWIWEVDANGLYTYSSPAVENMLGYRQEEVVNKKHFYDLFYPEARDEMKKAAFEVFSQKQPFRRFLNRNMHKSGKTLWLLTSGVPIVDEKGDLLGYRGADTDITNMKLAEEALRESEQRFRDVFDHAADGILIADIETKRFYSGNQMISQMLGYSNDEIINLSVNDIHPEKDLPYVVEQFEKQARKEIILAKDIPVMRKDGSVFYADVNSFPVKITGKAYLVGIFRDITDRKKVEKDLQESEEKYRSLVTNIPDVIWTTDINGNTSFISENVKHIYGYTPDEIYKEGDALWLGRIHPDDVDHLIKEFRALFEEGKPLDVEYRIKRKDGEWIWLQDKSLGTYEKDGVKQADGVFIDITDRKLAMEKILESESRFRGLVENSPIGIWQDSADQRTVYANRSILDMLEIENPDEITGKNWQSFFTQESLEIIEREHKKRSEGISSSYEVEIMGKRGVKHSVVVFGTPLFSSDGQLQGTIATFFDITERKKMEKEVKKKVKELEDFYQMAVGRELRMIELKNEIEKLKQELSKYKGS